MTMSCSRKKESMKSSSSRPDERGRDDAREQHEREPSLRVARQAALADGSEPGLGQLEHVPPEVREQRHERPHVQHDDERGAVDELVVPAQERREQDQVRRRADRQELGESLDDPDDDRLEDRDPRRDPSARRAGARGARRPPIDDPVSG